MSLPSQWGGLEEFATLFKYFWHRDFPIDQLAPGAKRADWTIHIGIVVRNIADLMGLVARFESGGRTDAVLRSGEGDEIAIEWEWGADWHKELQKLKEHKVWSKDKAQKERPLKYAVLIMYAESPYVDEVYRRVTENWKEARWPLLLILVEAVKSRELSSHREFKQIRMSRFDSTGHNELAKVPAVPWQVCDSRWYK